MELVSLSSYNSFHSVKTYGLNLFLREFSPIPPDQAPMMDEKACLFVFNTMPATVLWLFSCRENLC